MVLFLVIYQEAGKISGTVWAEEVVLHSTNSSWTCGKAMQGKMAQSFEAEHQGMHTRASSIPISRHVTGRHYFAAFVCVEM
jgi:hypothetical protein